MQAIRAARAFDGRRFLPGGATLLLDAGQIIDVQPREVDVPSDVEVTEYAGTLLPGLIDCHTHLVADATVGGLERAGSMSAAAIDEVIADSLRAHAMAGETTVRDLGDRDYRTLGFRERPGLPRVVVSGPPITVPGGHCHFLGGAIEGRMEGGLEAAVAERVERGVDVIKVMASGGFATPGSDQLGAQFSVGELTAIVEAGHRAGLPVVAHAHSLLGMQHAIAAGVDGLEHFTGLTSEGVRIDDALLDEVARRRMAVDLTLGNDRSLLSRMPEPPPAIRTLMESIGVRSFEQFYLSRLGELTRLRDHGITVVAGVDSGMGPAKRHGQVWRTVTEFSEAGFPAEEALAAATSVAAQACGIGADTGRLAAGLAADLLLVDGDLAQDLSLLAHPQAVLVRGVAVDLG